MNRIFLALTLLLSTQAQAQFLMKSACWLTSGKVTQCFGGTGGNLTLPSSNTGTSSWLLNTNGVWTQANTTTTGKTIDGSADEAQLTVQGHSTQTSDIIRAQTSTGGDTFRVKNNGEVDVFRGAGAGAFVAGRANTSLTAPSLVASGDPLGGYYMQGYDGAAYQNAASITAYADSTTGSGDMPGRIEMATTLDGASSPTTRLTLKNHGALVHNPSSGFVNFSYLAGTGASDSAYQMFSNTTDADDDSALYIGAGGDADDDRGAYIRMFGNEANFGANLGGIFEISAGKTSSATVEAFQVLTTPSSTPQVSMSVTSYGDVKVKNDTGAAVVKPQSFTISSGSSKDFDSHIGSVQGLIIVNVNSNCILYRKEGATLNIVSGSVPASITISVQNGVSSNSAIRVANSTGSNAAVTVSYFGVY